MISKIDVSSFGLMAPYHIYYSQVGLHFLGCSQISLSFFFCFWLRFFALSLLRRAISPRSELRSRVFGTTPLYGYRTQIFARFRRLPPY